MLTKSQLLTNERIYTARSKVSLFLRAMVNRGKLLNYKKEVILEMINVISDDKAFTNNQYLIFIDLTNNIKPIPVNRLKLITLAVSRPYQHYNQFGQRLK